LHLEAEHIRAKQNQLNQMREKSEHGERVSAADEKPTTLLDLPDDVIDLIWTSLPPKSDGSRRNFLAAHPCVRKCPAVLRRISHLRFSMEKRKRMEAVMRDMVRSAATSLPGAVVRRITFDVHGHTSDATPRISRFLTLLAADPECRNRIRGVERVDMCGFCSMFGCTDSARMMSGLIELCPHVSSFGAKESYVDKNFLLALARMEGLHRLRLLQCKFEPRDIQLRLEGVEELDLNDRDVDGEHEGRMCRFVSHATRTEHDHDMRFLTRACPKLRILRVPSLTTRFCSDSSDTVEHLHVDKLDLQDVRIASLSELSELSKDMLPRLRSIRVTHSLLIFGRIPPLKQDEEATSTAALASIARAEDSSPVLVIKRWGFYHTPAELERLLCHLSDTAWASGVRYIRDEFPIPVRHDDASMGWKDEQNKQRREVLTRLFPNASFISPTTVPLTTVPLTTVPLTTVAPTTLPPTTVPFATVEPTAVP